MDEVSIAGQAERWTGGTFGVLATTWSERSERDLGSPRRPRGSHDEDGSGEKGSSYKETKWRDRRQGGG